MSNIELIPAISISSTGLDAERTRMEVTANNLANVNSTSPPGTPQFKRMIPIFTNVLKDSLSENPVNDLGGVKVDGLVKENRDPIEVYAPYHPDADANGMIHLPNISPVQEMVDMISSTRAYEANLNLIKNSKEMADKTIEMAKA